MLWVDPNCEIEIATKSFDRASAVCGTQEFNRFFDVTYPDKLLHAYDITLFMYDSGTWYLYNSRVLLFKVETTVTTHTGKISDVPICVFFLRRQPNSPPNN